MKKQLEQDLDLTLMPGDLYVAERPMLIKTILGSCVSMILYCRRSKVTAITHAQLPEDTMTGGCCMDNCPVKCNAEPRADERFKYVTCSTQYIVELFLSMGIPSRDIEVKIFGGGEMVSSYLSGQTVGSQNIAAARRMIDKYSLKVVAEETGGKRGRTLYLYTDTARVLVKPHKVLSANGKPQGKGK